MSTQPIVPDTADAVPCAPSAAPRTMSGMASFRPHRRTDRPRDRRPVGRSADVRETRHAHPTPFTRETITTCIEPTYGPGPHCWKTGRRHWWGECRYRANGRLWKHCRFCSAREVDPAPMR